MSKVIIPHLCECCETKLWLANIDFDRNYVYLNGLYYCRACFSSKAYKKTKGGKPK